MADKKGLSDKVKSTINKAKGEIKDQFGNATDDPKLQAKGKKDKAKGAIQDEVSESKKEREDENNKE
ncbi:MULTISPECIES: CsbD family protein [Paraliobacillus]|uniref:CsbD family protein n=1 Tax=Paraliobacillus TaxID=200903 RepID=UPI000DD3747A|nr:MULTISPECIES: CsbD family protein [Paraliobacillus]